MSGVGKSGKCPFCATNALEVVLMETSHFYVLVDNAPLVEGHLLIVPKGHWACYGAVPASCDDELDATKRRVSDFLAQTYQSACFFEHGVFRQTVFHAHLHAFPLGARAVTPDLAAEATLLGGRAVRAQDDIRSWYAANGHYFYVEQAPNDETERVAALFPAEEATYFRVLGQLLASGERLRPFQPQAARRVTAGPHMRAVAEAWRRHDHGA
ncbi:MAG: HIT family protein [Ktedonobacterales bacterium]